MHPLKFSFIFLLTTAVGLAQAPKTSETIEVTATRIAEDVLLVPASITIVDGDELRARNATDLPAALASMLSCWSSTAFRGAAHSIPTPPRWT